MTYVFKYRHKLRLFWRKPVVIGHRYDRDTQKMVLYFPDGSIEEISEWPMCALILGVDWVAAQKKYMEDQAGQAVPVKR